MEEFRMARAFSVATVVRLFLPSVLLIPVWLVFIAFIPDHHRSELVILAAGATVALAGVRLVRWRQMAAATVVRLSTEGVEMEDRYGSRVRLAWRHVERIDVVESGISSTRTITKAGRIGVRTGAGQCIGLVGWGEFEIPHNAPNWLLAHRARLPIDPASGLQRISIPLGVVDPLWEHGPMGDQVRQHRPDLFQPTVAPGTHLA
ncbi:hypothetical protein E1295_05980 [Nonomuraea mesophila]|uniref:PH domain-containing protein n=1 Tax=Nonomuraea mesophila TaxID=2530382 RepID=A0A4R5FWC7_9ACTN|nr:hypothetical protein [Nonomuraea mesophila]TDE58158.1 hypothetical protein E1295_05980 [Nonomuraea mesophila]